MATRLREQVYRQYKTLGLTRGEMTILACIADRCRSDGTAGFPGKERIMRETGYCRRWVMICLRRLEAKGCLQPVSLTGGRGNKTSYHIPLNQFGDIVPAPPPPPDESFLDDQAPSVEASAPAIPETPQPPAVVVSQALVSLQMIERDEELLQIEALYHGQLAMQANEPEGSPRWLWWQQKIDQARNAYNCALEARGIVASDGQQPPIDEELEQQLREREIQQWQRRLLERAEARDNFEPGSRKWLKWNAMADEARAALNGLLYQQQGGYVT